MTNKEIQAQIKVLKNELNKLEELANKYEQFEFTYPEGKTYLVGSEKIFDKLDGCNRDFTQLGRYRLTEEGAELSLERTRKANRLEMLAEYLGGLKKFVPNEYNCYVFRNSDGWIKSTDLFCYCPGKVYMTKEVAIKIVDILNKGEYEL